MIPYVFVLFVRFRVAIFQSQNRKKKVEKSLYTELKREAYTQSPARQGCRLYINVYLYISLSIRKLAVRSPFLKMDHPMMTGRK